MAPHWVGNTLEPALLCRACAGTARQGTHDATVECADCAGAGSCRRLDSLSVGDHARRMIPDVLGAGRTATLRRPPAAAMGARSGPRRPLPHQVAPLLHDAHFVAHGSRSPDGTDAPSPRDRTGNPGASRQTGGRPTGRHRRRARDRQLGATPAEDTAAALLSGPNHCTSACRQQTHREARPQGAGRQHQSEPDERDGTPISDQQQFAKRRGGMSWPDRSRAQSPC